MSPCPPNVPASFKELYDQTVAFVARTLRRYGIVDAGLDDAIQDVYLVVYRRLDSFEGRSALSTWLYGIARRVAAHHRRKPQLAVPEPERVHELADAREPGPFETVARGQAESLVCKLVAEIPRERREIFVLAEIECLSGPEIADCLELPLETVYWRLRVARAEFERALERFEAREEWQQRRAEALSNDERSSRRSWLSLVAFLGADSARPPGVAIAGSAVSAKVGMAIVLGAAVAVGGAFALGHRSGSDESASRRAAEDAKHVSGEAPRAAEVAPPGPAGQQEEAADAPLPASAAIADASRPTATPAPARAGNRGRPPRTASHRTPRSEPVGAAAEGDVAPEPVLSIEGEARLLLSADRALRQRDFALAISLVDEHEREFEDGQLRRERQALAIAIDCLSGAGDLGEKRRALAESYGDAAISGALRRACGKSTERETN